MPPVVARPLAAVALLATATPAATAEPDISRPPLAANAPAPSCVSQALGLCHLGSNTRSHSLALAGALVVDPMLASYNLLEGSPAFVLSSLGSPKRQASPPRRQSGSTAVRPSPLSDVAGVTSDNLFLPSDNLLQISKILISNSAKDSPYRAYFSRRIASPKFIGKMVMLAGIFAIVILTIMIVNRIRFFTMLIKPSTDHADELLKTFRKPKPIKRRARSL